MLFFLIYCDLTDSTLAKWVFSLPRCIPICNALETFTGIESNSSEQHKDLRSSRVKKDNEDIDTFIKWLEVHPPFSPRKTNEIISLASGVIADNSVNCDEAIRIGYEAMQKMVSSSENFASISLHRKNKVKSQAAMKNKIKIRGEDVVVNPTSFFNRITCILGTSSEMGTFLQYELSPHPPSLFLDGQMRKTSKSSLGKALKSYAEDSTATASNSFYVIDGGYFLQTVKWPTPATYQEIYDVYRAFVIKKIGTSATIVFDGYDCYLSTKSAEQMRRSKKNTSAKIEISSNLPVTVKQSEFLGNAHNKK